MRPAVLQLKKRYWQHMKGFELLQKWLVLKHSCSWHPDCQCWMFKGKIPSTHHAPDATWSEWVAPVTQWDRIGNPSCPGILEVIMDWPEGKDFRISPEEDVTRAEESPLYNKQSEVEKQYAVVADVSCHLLGEYQRWKAALWIAI